MGIRKTNAAHLQWMLPDGALQDVMPRIENVFNKRVVETFNDVPVSNKLKLTLQNPEPGLLSALVTVRA